jgi:hypothetical protein
MYYRNPIKIMCTTRLNDGIFTTVFRCDTSSTTRIFRFYVYGGTFDNPSGYFFFFFFFCWNTLACK